MRDRFKILLLIALTLVLFFPAVRSGYFVVDDLPLVEAIRKSSHRSLSDFFQPVTGTYYRPLMGISYTLDEWLWEMKPATMHMENILIHAINAILVFLLVRRLTSRQSPPSPYLPFLAASLFVIHPANTESINWISGRSDPLATLFSLLAVYLFLLALQHRTYWPLWLAAFLTLTGALAKEVALFMLPGFILTLQLLKPAPAGFMHSEPGRRWRIFACLPFLAAGLFYGFLRSAAYTKADLGAGMILENVASEHSIWPKIETIITAFGFYLKKLIIPFPLSFAIGQIDPLYFWVGLIAVLTLLFCLLRRDSFAALILLALLPIAPALLVPVVKFAFMPAYAERYLYLTTAFFSIGLAMMARERPQYEKVASLLLLALVLVYLPGSIQRNLIWADHLEVLESADVQTLEYPHFWNAYCVALADKENYDKARNEFEVLIRHHPEDQLAYINLAKMELYIDDPVRARQVLEPFFARQMEPNEGALAIMVEVNQARLASVQDPTQNKAIRAELIANRRELFDHTGEPKLLLAAAESALENGEFDVTKGLLNRIIALGTASAAVTNETRKVLSRLKEVSP